MKELPTNNEKRRLEVLWHYDVLDTPAESTFDDLTELAAEICGAPIATITFVDEKRQWFKSKVGLDASETSRDISFCAHAIDSRDLLIVPDAKKDARFAKNPLVTGEPKIRFYAGAPLINSEGYALGTICVIDKVPRELNPAQRHALEVLSRHVVSLLEMRRRAAESAKSDEARRLAEDKYQRIFENAVEGIFQTTQEGKFLSINPAFAQMLGYASPEEVINQITDLGRQLYVHPEQRKLIVHLLDTHGSVRDFEAEFFRKDGSTIWARTSAHVVRDAAGKFLFYEGTTQDITTQVEAKQQLRQSEAQYRLLFEGNPHPMWVFDQESLRFLEVNEAAIEHYGYSREEFLAMTIRDIRPPEEIAAHAEYHAKVVSGEVKSGLPRVPNIWRHRKKNGTNFEVEIKWTFIHFRNAKAQLVLANDITERRRSEFQNETFTRLAYSLSSASSAEQAARVIVEAADKLLGWDACSLDLYSAEKNTIHPVLSIDLVDGHRADVLPAYDSIAPSPRIAKVIELGGTLILRDNTGPAAGADLRSFGNTERLSASILFVPIRHITNVIGVLSIQSYSTNAYNQKALEILQALADQCGGALERIGAEEKLAKERSLLRTLLDHLPDHIFVKDVESRHLLINKAQFKLRGLTDDLEIIGQTLSEVSTREVAEQFIRDDQEVFRTGQPLIDREEKVIDPEGITHWMLTTKVPLRDQDGNISGLVGISRDITERKRIESTLRETEEMFRLISENVSDLIAVVDADGRRVYNSPSYQRIFGEDMAVLKGTDSFAQVHPEDREQVRNIFNETLITGIGQRIEYRFLLPDGTIRHIESQGNFVGGQSPETNKIVVVSRDISERKRLEQRNAALSKLGQNLSAATSPKDAARVISETTRELFLWDMFVINIFSGDEHTVQPLLNIDTINGKRVEIQEKPGPPSQFGLRVIHEGAQLILKKAPLTMLAGTDPVGDISRPSASLMFVPIRSGSTVIGILSIQSYSLNAYNEQDLSALQTMADHCGGAMERIRAEEALRFSEVRFHSVWENSVDGMRLTDENGIIVAVNKSFCKLVDMSREELEGQPFTVTYASSENHADLLQKYKARFRDHTVARFFERKMTFRSGKMAELGGANSFVDFEGEKPLLLALFRDITDQKRLETQLRQSQKMDSIGQLAGGIAHDFNNLLTVIQGHASLLLVTEKSPDAADSLQQISMAAERSANLTRQLLTFSRRQVMQRRTLDLKEVVDEMTKMLRRILGEDIVLKVENSSNLPSIHADRGMMEQILLNLAVNSRDAMPRGGELTITTNAVRIDEIYTRQNTDAYLGQFICLKVIDSGCGIPPENMVHIFEPFFTTKEVGKGTGLGLATVYGIVKQHDGWIEVASELDKGTVFKIFFPRSSEPTDKSKTSGKKELPRGTETILVVEDETPLRELVQFLLERQGYKVLEAASGKAAIEVWKKHKSSISLLLTDLVMPEGMTGGDLSKYLIAENPNLKVIYTSGYSADIVGKDFVLRDGLNFLQKPYHPDKLAQTVRDCLDGK